MTVSLDSDPSTPVTLASILSSVHITTQMRTKDSDLVVTWFLIGNWFYHFRKKYQSQLNLLLTLRKQPCAVCDSNLGMIHVKPLDSEAFAGRKHQGHLWWGWPSTAAGRKHQRHLWWGWPSTAAEPQLFRDTCDEVGPALLRSHSAAGPIRVSGNRKQTNRQTRGQLHCVNLRFVVAALMWTTYGNWTELIQYYLRCSQLLSAVCECDNLLKESEKQNVSHVTCMSTRTAKWRRSINLLNSCSKLSNKITMAVNVYVCCCIWTRTSLTLTPQRCS